MGQIEIRNGVPTPTNFTEQQANQRDDNNEPNDPSPPYSADLYGLTLCLLLELLELARHGEQGCV